MVPLLPHDIWQCVASFIPYPQLFPLISVNKALYNIVMDAKYREIHWTMLDGSMIKSLVRLRTPSVAGRVRRLHVRAWFIEYLVQKEFLMGKSSAAPSYVVNSKRWFSRHMRRPSKASGGKLATAHDILEAMTAAVRFMTHITEYSFEWRDLSLTPDTLRFLTTARAAFGVSLRKLTLHAQLGNFTNLLSTVDFDNLEELELHFDHDHRVHEHSAKLLRESIAPFVNHFRRSIWSLLIASASKMDLSPLLNALQEFPHLCTLVARLAFDEEHLADPRALVQILLTNSDTLLNVEIGRSFAASSDTTSNPRSTWASLSTALASDRTLLGNLRSLKSPLLDTFDDTTMCLRRSADTLTRLCLVDCFLTHSELMEIVQVFAHRPFDSGLCELQVGLAYFTVDAFDLLASRLPGLSNLNLVVGDSIMAEVVHRNWTPSSFCISLSGHFYPDWQLSNLGIWEKRFADTSFSTGDETVVMHHLARCIPRLRTFKGVPKFAPSEKCPVWAMPI
ncbi:hypothetical protein B0H11DRAFT_1150291 [Mycena galericulata]|nr:hypothetical protein B0H11DRAFT_1150291 [Mycena galericulata]